MKFFLSKEKDSTFSFMLSAFIHAFVFLFVAMNTEVLNSLFQKDLIENNILDSENKEYLFLVETPNIAEEKNEDSIFVSDKSLIQRGLEDVSPDVFLTDQSTHYNQSTLDAQDILNSLSDPNDKNNSNNESVLEDFSDNSEEFDIEEEGSISRYSEPKIPATFNDGINRAVILSSETGSIQLGTKAQEYFWYFYSLVNSIRSSWGRTIPNQAHSLGLIRSDEVEVLLSIDENGDIAFEKFLKKSDIGQTSLDSSCAKAVEHAASLNAPPAGLFRDYAENGKIYIPFRFLYQNFSGE